MLKDPQIAPPQAFRAFAPNRNAEAATGAGMEAAAENAEFTSSRAGKDFSGVKAQAGSEETRRFREGGNGEEATRLSQSPAVETQEDAGTSGPLELDDKKPAAKDEDWVMDADGNLYYKTKKEAEDRLDALKKKGEWREFKIAEFKRGDKTFWRVLMRGKVSAGESKEPEKKDPDPGQKPEAEKKKEAEEKDPGKKPPPATLPDPIFALTFDDGPHSAQLGNGGNRTENVLDVLKAEGIKGAFFIQTGVSFRGASANGKKLVARMVAEGHTVGIHTGGTADHELHTAAAKKGTLESELNAAKTYVNDVTKQPATLVRPPTGAFNEDVSKIYAKVGLKNLMWDIDGDEGKSSPLGTLQGRLDTGIAEAKKQGWKPWVQKLSSKIVVLYHDIQKSTAENISTLIKYIRDKVKSLSGGKNTARFDKP